MNILKALFGGKTEDPKESKQDAEAKIFDILKFDGVKALHMGQADYAIKFKDVEILGFFVFLSFFWVFGFPTEQGF